MKKLLTLVQSSPTLLRYIISGGTAAAVDLGLLFILINFFHVWYLLSATTAFIFAVGVSFLLQKFVTFNNQSTDRHIIRMQASIFVGVALMNIICNGLLMFFFVDILSLHYMASQIIANVLIAITSFFMYRAYVFNDQTI